MNVITAAEAKRRMELNTDVLVLDVREADEYAEGHIPGAHLIPVGEIEDSVGEEIPDTEREILIYCRSGRRAITAAAMLENMGYENVYAFGGIEQWPFEIEVSE